MRHALIPVAAGLLAAFTATGAQRGVVGHLGVAQPPHRSGDRLSGDHRRAGAASRDRLRLRGRSCLVRHQLGWISRLDCRDPISARSAPIRCWSMTRWSITMPIMSGNPTTASVPVCRRAPKPAAMPASAIVSTVGWTAAGSVGATIEPFVVVTVHQ